MHAWVLAKFEEEEALLAAARRLRESGLPAVDVHSPVPIPGTSEALGLRPSRVPLICLVGGLVGLLVGYALQWWTAAVDFPINAGNRPPHSWPAFVPITFELGVLFAAVSVVIGFLALSGLPRPYHPVFESGAFLGASVDEFWLSVPLEDRGRSLVDELRSLGATRVEVVRAEDGG